MEPDAPTPVVKEWKAHDKATEVELEKKKELNKEAQRGKRGGGGAGRDIKPPELNLGDFNERRIRLARQINEMKNLDKFKTAPKMVTQKYQRGGRMMPGILARAAVTGQRREVRDIYQLPRYQYEENDVMMALLVDMSGSTDEDVMKDTFVLLAEAASTWMPQENFSLWAFGSDFQRIKDFTEDYQRIKGRIGGMKDLGGTVISPALFKIGEIFHEVRRRRGVKMIIILSDFQLSDPEAIEFLDKMANEENIIPMLIANGGRDTSVEAARMAGIAANKWCGGRYPIVLMPQVIDLPRRFLETYKVFASMNPKELESGRWRERFKGSVQTFGGSP
jgi:Mg-chelatase subunit ChlD